MRARQLLMTITVSLLAGYCAHFLILGGSLPRVAADCPGEPGKPCGNGDVNGDGSVDISDPIYLLTYLFAAGPDIVPATGGGVGLPATGQTVCYWGSSPWGEIECGSEEYPGQDGFYQKGCPMEGRFVDNGDGTVTDTCTGLTWQQATAPGKYTWAEALQYCEDLELGEATDWRLPNVRELQSIVDYGDHVAATDPVFSTQSTKYWSSSSHVGGPLFAWLVDFYDGRVLGFDKTTDIYVRAVRG